MSDVDKTTLKSQYLWFVCLDEDFDGILSLMDIYMLYTEFVEKCSKNFVSVARIVSFQNFLMLLYVKKFESGPNLSFLIVTMQFRRKFHLKLLLEVLFLALGVSL